MKPSQLTTSMERCWGQIGVWGDQTCPELTKWVHCQNCPVLGSAGRSLFDQAAPPDYLEECGDLLESEQDERGLGRSSILIFRLGVEWLALPTKVFQSVQEWRPIHPIPHRTTQVLLGLVNIEGGLQLCVSLLHLLEIEPAKESPAAAEALLHRRRLAFLADGTDRWVFPVDEVMGVHRHHADELQNVPVTVAKSAISFARGVLSVQGKKVGLLDDGLLFHHLKRSALR